MVQASPTPMHEIVCQMFTAFFACRVNIWKLFAWSADICKCYVPKSFENYWNEVTRNQLTTVNVLLKKFNKEMFSFQISVHFDQLGWSSGWQEKNWDEVYDSPKSSKIVW